MRRPVALLFIACALLAGCMQRLDADLPITAQAGDVPTSWQLAGSFGGAAQVSVNSSDPYQVRFAPGGFVEIAGVCATKSEVWVCDLGLSRIQIFDLSGNYLRSIGAGVPLAGTLVTSEQLYEESRRAKEMLPNWQDGPGLRWVGTERELFKISDVAVTDTGYWVADQVLTQFGMTAKRFGGEYFVPFDGSPIKPVRDVKPVWPMYVAYSNGILAASDPAFNSLQIVDTAKGSPRSKQLGAQASIINIMRLRDEYSQDPDFAQLERRVSGADSAPAKFDYPCGVAVAHDKVLVCDTQNHRIQIFEGRNRGQFWGKLLRVIMPRKLGGAMRFDAPRDVDVAQNGQVFVLDGGRNEVALLSSSFERLGSFARNEIALPWALDLSDDGRHCYITDRRTNKVFHYAATD